MGSQDAWKDLVSIDHLARIEGCGKEDRCWTLLLSTSSPADSFKMCCDVHKHGLHMHNPQHCFKIETFQAVREFRRSRGLDIPSIRGDGTVESSKQNGGQRRQSSRRPRMGSYYQRSPGTSKGSHNQKGSGKGSHPYGQGTASRGAWAQQRSRQDGASSGYHGKRGTRHSGVTPAPATQGGGNAQAPRTKKLKTSKGAGAKRQ